MPSPRQRKAEAGYYISWSDHRHTCVLSGWPTAIGVPASDVSLIAVCSATSPDVGNRTTIEQDLLRLKSILSTGVSC